VREVGFEHDVVESRHRWIDCAVVTFLGGFLFRLAYGIARLDRPESLEAHLRGVIAGVAAERARIKSVTM
jgi:hypothetical protein